MSLKRLSTNQITKTKQNRFQVKVNKVSSDSIFKSKQKNSADYANEWKPKNTNKSATSGNNQQIIDPPEFYRTCPITDSVIDFHSKQESNDKVFLFKTLCKLLK